MLYVYVYTQVLNSLQTFTVESCDV